VFATNANKSALLVIVSELP